MFNLSLLTGLCMSAIMQAQAWTGEKQEKPKERVVLKYGPITPAHRTDEADAKIQRIRIRAVHSLGNLCNPRK